MRISKFPGMIKSVGAGLDLKFCFFFHAFDFLLQSYAGFFCSNFYLILLNFLSTSPMVFYFFATARYMFNSHLGNLPHVSMTSGWHFKSSKLKKSRKKTNFLQAFFPKKIERKIFFFVIFSVSRA